MKTSKPTIVMIHGAFSSPISFNYIKKQISDYDCKFIDYSEITYGIGRVISDTKDIISEYEDVILIGHSLGGIISTNLLDHKNVLGAITISSPLAGLEIHPMTYFGKPSFAQEINCVSFPISKAKDNIHNSGKKVYSFLTTGGFNPFIKEINDGVVTLASQQISSHNQKTHIVEFNHHEVLMSETVSIFIKHLLDSDYFVTTDKNSLDNIGSYIL